MLKTEIWGNSIDTWLIAAGIAVGLLLAVKLIRDVLLPDYNVYMDIQQAINLEIFRQFDERGIRFAYPTQTVYLSSTHTEAASESNPSASIQPA